MKPIYIVQNWPTEAPGMIEDYVQERGLEYHILKNFDHEPFPSVETPEAVIVLGFPYTVNDYLKYDQMKSLWAFMAAVMRRGTHLMGMCFGGQMLAKILGAEVSRNPVKEIGCYRVSLTETGRKDSLFKGFDSEFDVFQWHADTFKIPRGSDHLAQSELCPNQAFRKGRSVGIQFHLDPRPEDVPNWCDEYAEELAEEGKSKDQVVAEYEERAAGLRTLCYRLHDNFLAL